MDNGVVDGEWGRQGRWRCQFTLIAPKPRPGPANSLAASILMVVALPAAAVRASLTMEVAWPVEAGVATGAAVGMLTPHWSVPL